MQGNLREEKATASQDMQDPSGEGTTQSPNAGNALVMGRPPSTVGMSFGEGISSFTEYYLAHVTSRLTFNSVPVFHKGGSFDCYFCHWHRNKRVSLSPGLGFLSDLNTHSNPNIVRTSELFGALFSLAAERGAESWLGMIHHFNVALFHMPPSKIDLHIVYSVQRSIIAHHEYIKSKIHCTRFHSTLEGGVGDTKAEEPEPLVDKKLRPRKEAKLRRSNDKKKPPSPRAPAQKGGEASVKTITGVVLPKSFCNDTDDKQFSFGYTGEAPEKESKSKQQQHSRGGRTNFRNDLVNKQCAEEGAREKGNRDAAHDQRSAQRDAEEERKRKEKETEDLLTQRKKAMTEQAYANGPSGSEFSARPALNVGVHCRRNRIHYLLLVLAWKNFSIPAIFTLLLSLCKASRNPGSRLVTGGTTMICGLLGSVALYLSAAVLSKSTPKLAVRKLHFTARISNQTREVSIRDADGDLVDTRPSEIKIGKTEMTQLEQDATLTVPTLVVATPQDHHAEGEPTVTVQRDLEFENKLLHVPFFGKLISKCDAVVASLTHVPDEESESGTLPSDSLIHSTVWPEVKYYGSKFVAYGARKFQACANAVLKGAILNSKDTVVALNPGVDMSFSVISENGTVNSWKTLAAGCLAALAAGTEYCETAPAILGSHSSATVASSGFNVEATTPVPRVLRATRVMLPFCAHSYNNAATYGALSSQVSPDSNYAMLYRKLSRYTAIAQNRFGNKELVTNAEILARLKYWAVREKPQARAAAAHF